MSGFAGPPRIAIWSRSGRLIAPDWPLVVLAASLLGLTTLGALSGPWILRYAIDHGLALERPDLAVVRNTAMLFLAVALSSMVLARIYTLLTGIAGERFVKRLRIAAFAHILAMSTRFHDRHPAGRLISRVTSDIDALQDLIQLGLAQFVQSVLTLALLAVILSVLSWQLALVALLPMPLLVFATLRFQRRSRVAYAAVRERIGETLSTLVESLAGAKVVQAFGQEQQRIAQFLETNDRQLAANIASVKVQARYLPAVELATATSIALALGVGGLFVWYGSLTIGTVGAFALYLTLAFEPIQALSFLFNQIESAGAALQKVFALLDEPVDFRHEDAALPRGGTLALAKVGFRYTPDGPMVLSHIDLRIEHRERLALVGPTGAGKSTLAKLIARLLDPDEGTATYGGVDLRRASPEALRQRIVMLSQEGHLFQGSIADNLRAVRPQASDADLEHALRRIDAWDRFAARPLGLAAQVGERGALLSSGERQLLALARVSLLDAELLILDEPTASLDPGTERQVNLALERLMGGRSVVLIAHRLSTMEQVDRIALVANGGIAELGSHSELMAANGGYAALYQGWLHAGANV